MPRYDASLWAGDRDFFKFLPKSKEQIFFVTANVVGESESVKHSVSCDEILQSIAYEGGLCVCFFILECVILPKGFELPYS